MKKIIVILFCLLVINQNECKAWTIGGTVTWECLSNGYYRFHLKVYGSCWPSGNMPSFPNPMGAFNVWNNQSLCNIQCSLVHIKAVFPDCNGNFSSITCASGDVNTVYEAYYIADNVILQGNPPLEGWVFGRSGCCNGALINIPFNTGNGSSLVGGYYSKLYGISVKILMICKMEL